MLLIYGDEAAAQHATPEQTQAVADEYQAFTDSIRSSGKFLDGDPFLPTTTAATVSSNGNGIGTAEGPAVTTTPQLIAYYKVDAADRDDALELARRVPHARFGSVEVREVVHFD